MYFEAQQQQQQQSPHQQQHQPFQIRRIEELNKTAGGNVEAKVMCFYRRRDLPAQLVALADKHQQHQQQQQLSLTLSLSPGGSSTIKGKQTAAIKASSVSDKDTTVDKKEQDTTTTGGASIKVKKEQRQVGEEEHASVKLETSEVTETVKEEQDVEMADVTETDSVASAVVKSVDDTQGEEEDCPMNDKCISIYIYLILLCLIF